MSDKGLDMFLPLVVIPVLCHGLADEPTAIRLFVRYLLMAEQLEDVG